MAQFLKDVHMSLTMSLFPFYLTRDFGHLTLFPIYTHFNTLKKKALGKYWGKDEIAQNE